jgi:hypothetical protein
MHKNFGWKVRREETTQSLRHKWEDSIKIDIREIRLEGVDWIHLAQDRDWWQALLNAVMNLSVA